MWGRDLEINLVPRWIAFDSLDSLVTPRHIPDIFTYENENAALGSYVIEMARGLPRSKETFEDR